MPGRSISAKAGLGLLVAFVMAPPTLALPPHVGATTAQEPGLARASSTMVVENVGQWDPAARFQVRGGANLMWLASGAIWLTVLGPDRTKPGKAPGGRVRVGAIDQKAQPGANIRLTLWSGVRYEDLYPGVDLEVRGGPDGPVERLVTRESSALNAVRLRIEGARRVRLAGSTLKLATAAGPVDLPLLDAVTPGGKHLAANPEPELDGAEVTRPFAAPATGPGTTRHSPSYSLSIDYSTYLGSRDYCDEDYCYTDYPGGIAADAAGSAYMVGTTYAPHFPTTPGAFDPTYNGDQDVFVTQLSPDGSSLVYSTFLGGTSEDGVYDALDVALDASGSAYVAAATWSNDFPITPGAADPTFEGGSEATLSKLTPDGTRLAYSTFLGGDSLDVGTDVALDGTGAAYVTGYTYSDTFPTTPGAFDTSFNGSIDAFATKVDPDGSSLVYSTFLGGTQGDEGHAVAVDDVGGAYVGGRTWSPDYPTTPGAFDTSLSATDGMVTKLSADGTALVYSTFLGGSDSESVDALAVSQTGDAFATGATRSSDYPTTPGSFDRTYNGGGDFIGDAYVTRLDPDGSALGYSTFVGGRGDDGAFGIVAPGDGTVFVSGGTASADFPVTFDADQPVINRSGYAYYADAFVARVAPDGGSLAYSSYLGGSDEEWEPSVALDPSGRVYLAGEVRSQDFPTTPGAFDRALAGLADVFVTRLKPTAIVIGVVRDASTHAPLRGADVEAVGPVAKTDRTDARGHYVIQLPPGSYRLTATLFGYGRKRATVEVGDHGAVRRGFALSVLPSYPVEGTVTDETGNPLSGARVSLRGTPLMTVTDPSGAFAFDGVPRGHYQVRADASRCNRIETRPVTVDHALTLHFDLATRYDAFGYHCAIEPNGFVDGETILPVSGIEQSTQVDLPFAFTFYGQTYTSVNVASSGFVSFVGTDATGSNTTIPDPAAPNAAIYPFWDRICVGRYVRSKFLDTLPVRGFVIEWNEMVWVKGDVCEHTGLDFDTEVILWENGEISLRYRNVSMANFERGDSATIGLENEDGSIGHQYSYDLPVVWSPRFGIRYTPPTYLTPVHQRP